MSPLTSPQYAARSALLLQSTGLTKSLFSGKSGGLMHPCKHAKNYTENTETGYSERARKHSQNSCYACDVATGLMIN